MGGEVTLRERIIEEVQHIAWLSRAGFDLEWEDLTVLLDEAGLQ